MADDKKRAIKGALNTGISAGDIYVGRMVERFVQDRVPKDSPLREDWIGTIFGSARGFLETAISFDNPLLDVLKEKLVDYLDFVGKALSEEGDTRIREAKATALANALEQDWVKQWWQNLMKRMAVASKSDVDLISFGTILEREFQVLWSIFENIEKMAKPEEPIPRDYDESWSKKELLQLASRVGAKVYKSWPRANLVEAIDKKLGINRTPEPERKTIDWNSILNRAADRVEALRIKVRGETS